MMSQQVFTDWFLHSVINQHVLLIFHNKSECQSVQQRYLAWGLLFWKQCRKCWAYNISISSRSICRHLYHLFPTMSSIYHFHLCRYRTVVTTHRTAVTCVTVMRCSSWQVSICGHLHRLHRQQAGKLTCQLRGEGGGVTGSGLTGVFCCRQTEFGIVYSCVEDKLFYAQRGRGAFLNGEPLHASGQEGDIIHTHMWHHTCSLSV